MSLQAIHAKQSPVPMRVISGSARGRQLRSPGEATRPITDRVKENLFNILGVRVIDANVLDLFAGAGSVGIEALSRGARHATFVELDQEALRALGENLRLTHLANEASIARDEVFRFIRRGSNEQYDLIYVAPPQYKALWQETLCLLDRREFLTRDGLIVAQIHPKEFRTLELSLYEMCDQRKYGSTMLCFYKRKD
jgi:16S rRNA (guanine966-N2)-methyltransferase